MKTLISFITLLLVVTLGLGQGYNNRYDFMENSIGETGWDIEITDTGNVVIGARSDGTGDAKTYLLFIDENGMVENETQVSIEEHDIYPGLCNGSVKTSDGSFFIGGSDSVNSETSSVFTALVDANGSVLWQMTYPNDFCEVLIHR